MATLKLVAVIISIFTQEKRGDVLRDYLWECLVYGMASTMFGSPNILAAFYTAGNDAYDALALAVYNWEHAPTEDNLRIVKDKMALVVLWLREYARQVTIIAN